MDETCDLLRYVWGTDNRRTLPLSATGSAGMEAAFVNTVEPGDVVVVAVNGLFGERMVDVAGRHGAEVVRVDHEWGQPVDVERVVAAHPSPKIIAAVHAETSTGVRSDIAALGAAKGDALLLVDAVTSIGGIELRADEWGIDIGYAGTQKCLGVAPGLAPFTINDRAFARRVEKPSSWYLDLGLLGGYVGEASGAGKRTYHHTAPTAMVASLHAGLRRIADEGLEKVWDRHAEAGRLLQDGLEEMGLDPLCAGGLAPARADDRPRARRRRLGRRARLPARAAQPRDRRRRRRVRLERLADRPDGPQRPPRPRRPRPRRPEGRPRPRRLTQLPRRGACAVRWYRRERRGRARIPSTARAAAGTRSAGRERERRRECALDGRDAKGGPDRGRTRLRGDAGVPD